MKFGLPGGILGWRTRPDYRVNPGESGNIPNEGRIPLEAVSGVFHDRVSTCSFIFLDVFGHGIFGVVKKRKVVWMRVTKMIVK